MSDTDFLLISHEQLLEKHRQEKKELQAKTAKLRYSVPKNDKKKKKDVTSEIETLEKDLKARHDRELEEWESHQEANHRKSSRNDVDESGEAGSSHLETRANKSQRRRENKERKERERQERIRLGQVDDSENIRLIEMKRVENLLESRNLTLCEIPSDGDCMYKAIEHQLKLTRDTYQTVEELRYEASEYIRGHKDDFLPFLLNDDNSVVTDKEFEVYCDKIANTKTWGGHLELKALSNRLKVPIEIIQAEGSSIQIGFTEFGSSNPLILCYFRHAYQLGEHYNSVMPNGDVADEEEWQDEDGK